MNCDQTIERLPWLLNGTLGEDERQQVRQHLATCPSCRQALADTQQAWQIFDQHIPAADLVAYAAGETDGTGKDRSALFAEHLASCPECAAELELVRTSRGLAENDTIALLAPRQPRPAPATVVRPASTPWKAAALAAGLAGLIAANGWYQTAERAHTLAGRLAVASTPATASATPSVPSAPSGGAPAEVSSEDSENVAALQSQLESMQKTLGELQTVEAEHRQQLSQIAEARPAQAGPQINTWVGDAREGGDVVRGSNDTLEVPAGAAMATLILRPTGETQGGRGLRDIEITDAQGKVVWKAQGLRLDPVSQDYSLTFHRGDLAPGDYVIRLYRQDNGQRAAAEIYPIQVK